jgi:hypothetical protein
MILCDFENLTSNRFWMVLDILGMVQKVGYHGPTSQIPPGLNGGEWQGGWGTKTHHADEFRTWQAASLISVMDQGGPHPVIKVGL